MVDDLVTQRELADEIGCSEEHLSRALREVREAGGPLPAHAKHPLTGVEGWAKTAFLAWWSVHAEQLNQPPLLLREGELRQAVADGLDAPGMAERFGVDQRAVWRAARRYGVPVETRRQLRRRIIRQCLEARMTPGEIIAVTGYPYGSVYRYLRDLQADGG